jgi:hypothetical protein
MGKSCEMFYLFFGFFFGHEDYGMPFSAAAAAAASAFSNSTYWFSGMGHPSSLFVLPAAADVDVDVAVCLLVVVWLLRLGFLVPEVESGCSNFSQDM